jgi:pyruvate kinase
MKNQAHLLRRTKIIATLGPATDIPENLEKIIMEGVNVVRLNLSHGTHEEHRRRIEAVRAEGEKQDRIIGILVDLQGPKIRVSRFKDGKITLKTGDIFALDASLDTAGDQSQVGIDYKDLPQDVTAGDTLLLDDGRLTFTVKNVEGPRITCVVNVGGILSNNKGINRKGGGLSARALTDKDREDLKFAVENHADYIAISFPRNAEDILEAKALISHHHGTTGVIAKIERTEAMDEIDEIIEASDGVMVARGDLAVEIGDAEVPLAQKHIIHRARALNRPVIIATQMMESMITSTVPTRAEVSDVANAVLDNVDAVMLSAETAVGENPGIVIEAMSRVCVVSERQPSFLLADQQLNKRFHRVDEGIAMATIFTANHLNIKAVVALTESGGTTLWMSRIPTAMPIYGLSRFKRALGKMTLYRGVYPVLFDVTKFTRDEVNPKAIEALEKISALENGDRIILTKGDQMGVGGGSNAMKILIVGQVV